MTQSLLLDEHYSPRIAAALRRRGYDVVAVAETTLRQASDDALLAYAAREGRRIVTFNVKDFRPRLAALLAARRATAGILCVPPRLHPGRRAAEARFTLILAAWLDSESPRGLEEWLLPPEPASPP